VSVYKADKSERAELESSRSKFTPINIDEEGGCLPVGAKHLKSLSLLWYQQSPAQTAVAQELRGLTWSKTASTPFMFSSQVGLI